MTDLPKTSAPAQRALDAAGLTSLHALSGATEAEVAALHGMGPKALRILAEALAAAGEKAGLPRDLAMLLARQTVVGAGALMGGVLTDAATLRKNVTSPGGTTAAALAVLMGETGWQGLIDEAVAAAVRRSRELAG